MTLQKGANLSGLGTFTFSLQNIHRRNRITTIHQPIFILAGKLAQSLGLSQVKQLVEAAHLPVLPLNFAAVSQRTPFSRGVVESCVRETLAELYRALASEKNVVLPFKPIGVLSFRNNKVQMKFSRDFVTTVSKTHKRAGRSVPVPSDELTDQQGPRTIGRFTLPTIWSSQTDNQGVGKDGGGFSPSGDMMNTAEVPQQRELKSNQSGQMKAVCLAEELNPVPPVEATSRLTNASVLHGAPPNLDQHPKNASYPSHIHTGQELCYLCMQRALRNVPEYQREQQEAVEKAQRNVLLCKQQLRDKQEMEAQLAKLTEQREHAKQVAAFNLQMSKTQIQKSSCSDCPKSFLFLARPITPPKRMLQHCYMNDLQSQMESRQRRQAQDQQYRLLTERLDQIQLIQEIAYQKAEQFQQKQEKTRHYKKALDTQVEDKMFTASPTSSPDKPRLTRCETAIRRAESRERAKKLFQVNFSVASQKKKEEMQSRQLQLEKEREMLRRTKIDLMQDKTSHFEKKHYIRMSLEDEWSQSAELKRRREEEEKRFLRSAGQLLVDKLEECRRCCRCKRRMANCGETNIWRDSRYLSGSQFMI
ncbi:coiled-coil domain-containing protein 81 [Fundulus heteroclitus]|uniref:coiled-coil domain-containing protein 81 n=1 Tax=Fundulus heteroclitus TaxID=8078 RepID=UPI00165B641D|nr:coiled-coil domain-containing protein 81 [Fundulus heteroclitus]